MTQKLPPQNIDAEESVLAGCLLYSEMADEAVGLLRESDFYRPSNQKIFAAIQELKRNGEPVDLTTTTTHLKATGQLDTVGGAVNLARLTDTPIPSSVPHYAKLIKNASTLRQTIALCSETITDCFEGHGSLSEILNTLQSRALNLGIDTNSQEFCTMADLSEQSIERYESLRQNTAGKAIRTRYHLFDKLTGGLRGSKLIIVAARPGMGKTAFMCNMVENMARDGVKACVFELEMDKEELDDRWNASLAGINTVRLTSSQKLESDEWERLNAVAAKKSTWPVLIDDTGGMRVDELVRRARIAKRMGAQIIFIDQLSFIRGNGRKSVFEINTEHVEALGQLKKELRIPVVLLAQLNRELEKRGNKKPMLSDLKNTGMLEEAADMVLLGFRKHFYTKLPEDEHHAEWELSKNRGGPTMNIEMVWMPKQARFENKARETAV